MSQFVSVVRETFLRLRRDKIFLPAAVVGSFLLLFSGLASYWGVEEFFKILYDLGTTAFHLTGATVAIFWGIKTINDSQQEGSIEVQLASPIGRIEWLLARYTGLATALVLLALIFILGWQGIYSAYDIGFMGWHKVGIFVLLTLSWLVIGAAAICLATLSSYAIALFSSFWLFVVGLLTAPLLQSMSPDTPDSVRKFVELLAGVWNLHYFNLYELGTTHGAMTLEILSSRFTYGVALIAFFMGAACWNFHKKDLAG